MAEVDFTAFTVTPKNRQVPCRLVVRRVPELNPAAEHGQDELFTRWRYHAFITNSTLTTVHADEYTATTPIVEQVIAELKDGPLAHLPSGKFTANAAWLALTCIAFNLARAAGAAASARHARARWATLRRHLINIPARIATSARRVTVHLPPTLALGDRLARPLGRRPPTLTGTADPAPRNHPTWKSRTDRPFHCTFTSRTNRTTTIVTQQRATGSASVESAWGAVSGLLPVRFPRPLAEPGVRLSPHRALHGSCRRGVVAQGPGVGTGGLAPELWTRGVFD